MNPTTPTKSTCAALLMLSLSGLAQAAVPVGSVVLYSNGKVEKLLSNRDGKLLWEDDRKRRSLRSSNPIVPRLERHYFLSRDSYRQTIRKGNPALIQSRPLGSRVRLEVERTRHSGATSIRYWDCFRKQDKTKKVLGTRRVLESYVCERFVQDRNSGKKSFRERQEYHYSRDLGVIVEMKRKTRKKTSRWKISAIVPPEQAGYKRLSKKVRKLRKSD